MYSDEVDELVCLIACMDRPTITRQLLESPTDFPVDFTPQYLAQQTLEHLRHLLFALCMTCRHAPRQPLAAAA